MRDALTGKPRIKLLASDVDGVLTDGGMYFGVDGQVMKRFNVKDGQGMAMLRDSGVRLAYITRDSSPICRSRGDKLGVHDICIGVPDKTKSLQEIMDREGFSRDEVVYMGDDIPDLCLAPLVGIFAAPADAVEEVLAVADFVAKSAGGHGAMREVCDAIRMHNEAFPQ